MKPLPPCLRNSPTGYFCRWRYLHRCTTGCRQPESHYHQQNEGNSLFKFTGSFCTLHHRYSTSSEASKSSRYNDFITFLKNHLESNQHAKELMQRGTDTRNHHQMDGLSESGGRNEENHSFGANESMDDSSSPSTENPDSNQQEAFSLKQLTFSQNTAPPIISVDHASFSKTTDPVEFLENFFTTLLQRALEEGLIPQYPPKELKEETAQILRLDAEQMNKLLSKVRRLQRRQSKHGGKRKNARQLLHKWIDSHNGNLHPSSEQYAQLHEETGLTKDELYSFFYQQRHKGKPLNEQQKEDLKKWYHAHWRDPDNRDTEKIKSLCEKLSISRPQMLKYLWIIQDEIKFPPTTITEEVERTVAEFVKQHPKPSSEQISTLQERVQVSRSQLYTLMRRFRDPHGEVTSQSKEIIYDHINRSGPNQPLDIPLLQKLTNLSKRQIQDIKRRYNNTKFSPEKRWELEQLWNEGYRSIDDYIYRSSLSREQIRRWLWKKKKHHSESGTSTQEPPVQLLMNQAWKNGERDIGYYMKISDKSRVQIQKWMWKKRKMDAVEERQE